MTSQVNLTGHDMSFESPCLRCVWVWYEVVKKLVLLIANWCETKLWIKWDPHPLTHTNSNAENNCEGNIMTFARDKVERRKKKKTSWKSHLQWLLSLQTPFSSFLGNKNSFHLLQKLNSLHRDMMMTFQDSKQWGREGEKKMKEKDLRGNNQATKTTRASHLRPSSRMKPNRNGGTQSHPPPLTHDLTKEVWIWGSSESHLIFEPCLCNESWRTCVDHVGGWKMTSLATPIYRHIDELVNKGERKMKMSRSLVV